MNFFSKRNKVTLIEYKNTKAVRKDFMIKSDCALEKKFYQEMSEELQVPKVLEAGSDFLILEYIDQKNMYDVLVEQAENGFEKEPWEKLWNWILKCKEKSGKIPSDGNIRNYLWNETTKNIYGIDFEEYKEGALEEAYANFCVQIKGYHLVDESIIENILKTIPTVSAGAIEIANAGMKERRKTKYPLPISAVILAGGKSTRMGQDKATVFFDGKTFLDIQIDKMKEMGVGEILLSRASDVADIYPGKGPLGGMHACFKKAKYTNCLVVSVDSPLVNPAFLNILIKSHLASEADATITKNISTGKNEPLIGVYKSRLHENIEQILEGDKYAVFRLLEKIDYQELEYDGNPQELINCNSRIDISEAEKLM